MPRTSVRWAFDCPGGWLRLSVALGLLVLVALLAAPRAEAVPSITFQCTPAPEDCSGWHRANVSIDWTVLPSNATITGCQDKTYSADTPGTSEFCSARDGGVTSTVQLEIQVDQTPPVSTGGTPSRAADLNGWYNHPVGITFTGSDQTSGIDSCTATTYSGDDSPSVALSGTCRDRAGNVSLAFPYGLKYDETRPSVTGAPPERAANTAGWFNRPIGFDVQGTDATSGIAQCPSVIYPGPDSATASFTGTCTDNAGNSAARTFLLKYDGKAPAVTGAQPGRGPNANGWYRDDISVAFSGSDQLSGVRSCSAPTYAGPDSSAAVVSGTCTDEAGNVSSPFTFSLKFDATNPFVSGGQFVRAADANGWYNHDVSVAFNGGDQTSGLAACTAASYTGPDSPTASVPGTCTDRAGNTSSALNLGLKYDESGPILTGAGADRLADANGWYNHAVGFDFVASDPTSGVADCTRVTYGGPDNAAGSVTGRCLDRAGNASTRPFALKYDETPANVTGATPGRAANPAGWYNRSVLLTFNGTDQTSGVDACTSTTYGGPDSAATSVAGTCTDRAGNRSAQHDFGLKYDETAPRATSAAPGRPPNSAGWYNRNLAVAFSGSDGTSGVATCESPSYAGPDSSTASVSGTCTDRAGNTSSPLGFGLKYDETAPKVTGAQAERPPNQALWYVEPVRFDFTGFDATSGVADCPSVEYSGPDGPAAEVIGECRDHADNTSQEAFPLRFDGNPPEVTDLRLAAGNRRLDLSWQTTADVESVQVVRSPGIGADGSTVVFGGPGTAFVDERVDNGVSYAYRVTVRDIAGNTASRTVTGVPTAPAAAALTPLLSPPIPVTRPGARRLIAPLPGASVPLGHPPLLQWTPVRRARYYNLQLFRAGRKQLTAWPRGPRYQLQRRWTFAGTSRRLAPGQYRWMVWPGFGPRSKANYGKLIGRSTFVVKR
jgi:hypothetical protein